jgi:hypothetical protein
MQPAPPPSVTLKTVTKLVLEAKDGIANAA